MDGSPPPVRGRVLYCDRGQLVIQRPGGELISMTVPDGASARAGDLVAVVGTGAAAAVEVVQRHPNGEYPPAHGADTGLAQPRRWTLLRRRAELLDATRAFFRRRSFLEVETPLVVASAGTEVHLAATRVTQSSAPGHAPAERFLITSPEYHMKRLLAAGSPPIFQVCRVFRDGERGSHHRPEFTMLEWYRPWAGFESLLRDCEELLTELAGGDELVWQGRTIDLSRPFPRLRFLETLRTRGAIVEPERLTTDEQLAAFVDHVEPTLGRERAEFLIDWPIGMASLARPCPHDPSIAERVELFAAGLELGNGFGELTDATEQRRRCEADNAERRALGLPTYPLDEDFLAALEQGMPPSAGIAVGFDRLVMLLADAASIDEVVAF